MPGEVRGSVHVDGAELRYVIEGAGRPLLVAGSSVYYPRTFSPGLRRSCSIVCADLPHFAPATAGFEVKAISFELYARCIEAVRKAAGLGRVVIAGHSHHGNVALAYARRFPQHVSHVVLIGTPPADLERTVAAAREYWERRASPARKALLQSRRAALDEARLAALPAARAYIERYVADAPLYWHEPAFDAAWLWRGMEFGMEAVAAFRELYRDYDAGLELAGLDVPLLVVMGRDDFAVPHTLWEGLLPAQGHAACEVFDRSGHTPQLEEPDCFDQCLLDWLHST